MLPVFCLPPNRSRWGALEAKKKLTRWCVGSLSLLMSQSVVRLPAHVMRSVMQELKELSTHPLEGVKVIPNEKDVTEITAVIEGPGMETEPLDTNLLADTPFAGGSFMIKLKLGPDFPASPPKGFFVTNIFHPNIRPGTGEICVNTLKKDWKETLGFKHVLLVCSNST